MRVAVLLENKAVRPGLRERHGLSLYLETDRHRVLFDMGPDDSFLENAACLGIHLEEVDTAVLSHGHHDHGGGLEAFLRVNAAAPVYIRPEALGEFYSLRDSGPHHRISLPASVRGLDRLVETGPVHRLDDELTLFSDVRGNITLGANRRLKRLQDGQLVQDTFRHEQNLLVTSGGKAVLFAGCAHSGILAILDRCRELLGRDPDVVLGGFHLYSPGTGETEPKAVVQEIGRYLAERPAVYYTGHCTGGAAFRQLEEVLGRRLRPLHGGMEFLF